MATFLALTVGSCTHDKAPTSPPTPPGLVKLRVYADLSRTSSTTLRIVVDPFNAKPTATYTLPADDHIVDQTIEIPSGADRTLAISTGDATFAATTKRDIDPDVVATSVVDLVPLAGDKGLVIATIGSVVVEVRPGATTMQLGTSARLSATRVDTSGASTSGSVQWYSEQPLIASVDSAGLVTARAAVEVKIAATIGDQTGYAEVQVTDSTLRTGDISAPVINGFSFEPDTIDVTTDSAMVTVRLTLTDSLSGVAHAAASFLSSNDVRRTCGTAAPATGTTIAGTWQCNVYFQRGSPAGAWRVTPLEARDRAGNELLSYNPSAYPTLQVVNAAVDTSPPFLTSLTIAPDTLDFSSSLGKQALRMNVGISDAESGVDSLSVFVESPPTGSYGLSCDSIQRIAGSKFDGTWTCPITLSPAMTPGTWSVIEMRVFNVAGDVRVYRWADLAAASFPTTFQVIAPAPDNTQPVLSGFTLTPDTVDVRGDSAVVTARFTATDVGSGIGEIRLWLGDAVRCEAYAPETGTATNGTWSCRATIPYLSPGGSWSIRADLVDNLQNVAFYDSDALQKLGGPTSLEVFSAVTR